MVPTQNLQEPLMRDLKAAREAYSSGNVEASRVAHTLQIGGPAGQPSQAHEAHMEAGGHIKSVVFGG